MAFKLSSRSLKNLEGVDQRLVDVVKLAITLTKVDFGVIEGVRTAEKQLEYFQKGASQIAVGGSHVQGKAVDLMAYIGDRGSWEINLYDDIADSMKFAAIQLNVPICWGAAWHIPDIRKWDGTMQDATDAYVKLRYSQGKRPFIDGPHFEITG
jgi:peptidoglycan L-alanyl-D-glutamate endopeptidase CwlK